MTADPRRSFGVLDHEMSEVGESKRHFVFGKYYKNKHRYNHSSHLSYLLTNTCSPTKTRLASQWPEPTLKNTPPHRHDDTTTTQ